MEGKAKKECKKSYVTNLIEDFFSPLPPLNKKAVSVVNKGLYRAYEKSGTPEKDRVYGWEEDLGSGFGVIGIIQDKVNLLEKMFDMSIDLGEDEEFITKDFLGNEISKNISEEDKDLVQKILPFYVTYLLTGFPREAGYIMEKTIRRIDRKSKKKKTTDSKTKTRKRIPITKKK